MKQKGQMLVELVLAIGIAAIMLPALLTGLVASREGKPQQEQRVQAITMMKETEAAVKSIRDNGWSSFAINGTFHPVISGSAWALSTGASTSGGLTKQVVISDVYRSSTGDIVPQGTTGSTVDLSTKKADITITWTQPKTTSIYSTLYLTRVQNAAHTESLTSEFNLGVKGNTQVTTTVDGEVKLANNNKAKWCSPVFTKDINGNDITIDLPDANSGPPVALAATASAVSTAIPNDVFVATAPNTSSTIKMSHVNVTANSATPSASLRGKFTMDAAQFSAGNAPQAGTGLTNSFKTTDIIYYKSGNNTYALLGTDLPNKEVIAVWVNDGNSSNDNTTTGEFQDPVNKIYKYKTFFNTRQYNADSRSTPNQDQSPYGYGASSIAVLGTRGYVASGGYLYVFNLSGIDTATTATSLPMLGCRIEIDGFECNPGSPGTAEKYDANQTGASWGHDATPIHNDCSDGGNIETKATNDVFPVSVGGNTYVYLAVGGVTNPEFEIVNVTTVPSTTRSDDSSCGTISGGDATWRVSGSKDFNTGGGTEEAANSVFANSDGSRAYISSNGGSASKQFYILNTSSKTAPAFLSGSATPSSGYYNGDSPAPAGDSELYPRRSMTVLNGQRAVLVGKDGVAANGDAEEYQVLNTETEATPTYCQGINFDQGFNDLTSVAEADFENYVYMVANTQTNELKIIEGGPDNAIYVTNGTFESKPFDTATVDGNTALRAYNRFLANVTLPTNTTLELQTAVAAIGTNGCSNAAYSYVGPDGTSATKFHATTTPFIDLMPLLTSGNYLNPGRCFKYKLFLSTTDQMVTPVFSDITWNYSQ
jgi:type II secretory pathway pseudopilin PulG